MGALNQPSREEMERRRAARALHTLGWLFVCLVLYEFYDFLKTIALWREMGIRMTNPAKFFEAQFSTFFSGLLEKRSYHSGILLAGAAGCAAFLAAKGMDCRQRWAKILGTVVAVFAMTLLPGTVLVFLWNVNTELYQHPETLIYLICFKVEEFWLILSVPCLVLGVITLFAMRHMRIVDFRQKT